MGVTIISGDGRFEWDSEKNRENEKDHGFAFEEILDAFEDPFFLETYDEEHSSADEERWKGIASFDRRIYFYISFTERERIRIISARLAETAERARYDENYQNLTRR
ncbi:MAG: BrnT family toxin [Spirochaetaceae bacterium]|jgi:uncharacterized DUF497 family protein|nr:BrnT family toxin [Spirochaetaceae bacterium]